MKSFSLVSWESEETNIEQGGGGGSGLLGVGTDASETRQDQPTNQPTNRTTRSGGGERIRV